MRKYLIFLSIIFILPFLVVINSYAQYELEKGQNLFYQNEFEKAIEQFEVVLKKGTMTDKFVAIGFMADAYTALNDAPKAERYARFATSGRWRKTAGVAFRSDLAESNLRYGAALRFNGKYKEAKELYTEYLGTDPDNPDLIKSYIAFCDSAENWLDDEYPPFAVKEVKKYNTKYREFSPVIWNDSIVVFTSERPKQGLKMLDLYKVDLNPDVPTYEANEPELFDFLNTKKHEGSMTFSPDGKTVYFTRTVKGDKIGQFKKDVLNIFKSEFQNGQWTDPTNDFPFNSKVFSTGHPSLSSDGNILYFMCDSDQGYGGADIYYSKNIDGKWNPPVNLGNEINTAGNELFPFVFGNRLYFSSDMHPGMGKLDIFEASRWHKDSLWSNVTNLRPPLNSRFDDFGFTVFQQANKGFFSSNRKDGTGDDDIYLFIRKSYNLIILDELLVKLESYKFFDNMVYKVKSKDMEVPLDSNDSFFFFTAQDSLDFHIGFYEDTIFENNVKLNALSDIENEVIFQADFTPETQPVMVSGKLKLDGKLQPGQKIFILKYGIPIDTTWADEAGEYLRVIPNDGRYTLLALTPEGEREFAKKMFVKHIVTVKDEKGNLISGVNSKVDLNGETIGYFETDLQGKFKFTGMKTQKANLLLTKSGYPSFDSSFVVQTAKRPGDPVEITVYLRGQELKEVDLTGKLTDKDGNPLPGTEVTATNTRTKERTKAITGNKGRFKIKLHENNEYNVVATKGGYFQLDTTIQTVAGPVDLTIELEQLQINRDIRLGNIYYDYDKWNIRKDALPNLEKAVDFMRANPKAIIELNAHTDTRGGDTYNMVLSQKRAESARSYLIKKGIDQRRIIAVGYGEFMPLIFEAKTEEEHQENRRTQFKVLGYLDYLDDDSYIVDYKYKNAYYINIVSVSRMLNPQQELFKVFNGADRVKSVLTDNRKIKYFIGPIDDRPKAEKLLERVKQLGYKRADITAYKNRQIILIQDLEESE